MDRDTYEKQLKERQEQHLKNVHNLKNINYESWKPCLHDQCTSCYGTGINHMGNSCIHSLSCDCPKCRISYF